MSKRNIRVSVKKKMFFFLVNFQVKKQAFCVRSNEEI